MLLSFTEQKELNRPRLLQLVAERLVAVNLALILHGQVCKKSQTVHTTLLASLVAQLRSNPRSSIRLSIAYGNRTRSALENDQPPGTGSRHACCTKNSKPVSKPCGIAKGVLIVAGALAEACASTVTAGSV